MHQYFFVLGKTPELSKAEIYTRLNRQGIGFSVLEHGPQYFILQTDQELNILSFFKNLGGSIKAGQILKEVAREEKSHVKIIENTATLSWLKENVFSSSDKRTNFGFSIYSSRKNVPFRLNHSLKKLGVRLKKELQQQGKISRFVTAKHADLSSVVVGQNKLIDQGADICAFLLELKVLFGKTLAVQDYKKSSEKDYGRPGRDAKSGMIPPKLARMMINLARLPEDQLILDPFCGSGTILMEALDLGYKNIQGSDISQEAVNDSQKNISWYLRQFGRKEAQTAVKICDAKKLPSCYPPGSVAAIITEPYLGPPLKGNETSEQLKRTIALLEEIYLQSFNKFTSVLKNGGTVVIVVPALLDRENNVFRLNIVQKIEKLGFVVQTFPEYITSNQRQALEYSRKGQRLIREIFVFKKK